MAFEALIVDTLLPEWPLLDRETRAAVHSATTAHVAGALRLAPLHVRLGVSALSFAVGAAVLALSIGAGRGALRRLRAERLYALLQRLPGPFAAVVRLYRSVALLAFYEHPAVAPLLMAERRG